MSESDYLHVSHNISNLVYHFVCPAKYHRVIFTEEVDKTPTHSLSEIIRVVKSITARRKFAEYPEIKKALWGGQLWTDGYFVSTVGKHSKEDIIAEYVRKQGKPEDEEHMQLSIFD